MRARLAVAALALSAAAPAQAPRVLVLADPATTTALQRELSPLIDLVPTNGLDALSAEPRPDGLVADASRVTDEDRARVDAFAVAGGSVAWFHADPDLTPTEGDVRALRTHSLDETEEPGPAHSWSWPRGSGRLAATVWHDARDADSLRHLGGLTRWLFDPHTREAPAGALRLTDRSTCWTHARTGEPLPWQLSEGILQVVPGKGSITTTESFGDMRLHLEFRIPQGEDSKPAKAQGNSGVYIQRRYEVQILDSFGTPPEPKGCGSLYGQRAADVNASRPTGEWQSYDIWFRSPRWDANGERVERARITVVHNHTMIHRNVELSNKTGAGQPEAPNDAPLLLQDHGAAVQFRNVWLARQ